MKRYLALFIAVAILMMTPAICSARWVYAVSSTNNDTFYYDDGRFGIEGDKSNPIFVSWCKIEQRNKNEQYVSKLFFDVARMRYFTVASYVYRNGKSTTLSPDTKWQEIVHGSTLEGFMYAALDAFLAQAKSTSL